MNISDNRFAEAVSAIQKRAIAETELEMFEEIANQGLVSQLVAALVSGAQKDFASEEESVQQTMADLESLGEHSQSTACVLMAALWPIAGRLLGMHDVCNSIDLWIADCHSEQLTAQIKSLARSEADLGARRHYEEWIQWIEKPTGGGVGNETGT